MTGTIAEQATAVEQNAFVNIGQAYYGGARTMKDLKMWLFVNKEMETFRWVRRNPSLEMKWLNDQAGE